MSGDDVQDAETQAPGTREIPPTQTAPAEARRPGRAADALSYLIPWQRASDMRQVATQERDTFNRWFDERGWRGAVGKVDPDHEISIADEEMKLEALILKSIGDVEAISVQKGRTQPGEIFQELQHYVNSVASRIPPNLARYAFLRTKQEALGLGHTGEEETATVQPELRSFVRSLHFASDARTLELPEEYTLVDFGGRIARRCHNDQRDAFLVIDASMDSEVVGEGKSWTLLVLSAIICPTFDLRTDVVYAYDLARYDRFKREISEGRVQTGEVRTVDELDNALYKRDFMLKRIRRSVKGLKRNRKFGVVQGGAANNVFELDDYVWRVRMSYRIETRRRGSVVIWRRAGPQHTDKEKDRWGRKLSPRPVFVPGPEECGLRDVEKLYQRCVRFTERALPDEEEVEDLYAHKPEELVSPLDEELSREPRWGLELLEDEETPSSRMTNALSGSSLTKQIQEAMSP